MSDTIKVGDRVKAIFEGRDGEVVSIRIDWAKVKFADGTVVPYTPDSLEILPAEAVESRDPVLDRLIAQKIEYVANKMALRQPPESMIDMDQCDRINGIRQMLQDLQRLAQQDGCAAAGWALEVLLPFGFTNRFPTDFKA